MNLANKSQNKDSHEHRQRWVIPFLEENREHVRDAEGDRHGDDPCAENLDEELTVEAEVDAVLVNDRFCAGRLGSFDISHLWRPFGDLGGGVR